MGVHEAHYWAHFARFGRDCRGRVFSGWVAWKERIPEHGCLRIRHYWTKSLEEWLVKRKRGKADLRETRGIDEYWQFGRRFGINDTGLQKHSEAVKSRFLRRVNC
jgi:hypothetical protein